MGQPARDVARRRGRPDPRRACSTTANTTYLGRPVFGGITAGDKAYDATGAYVGTAGAVHPHGRRRRDGPGRRGRPTPSSEPPATRSSTTSTALSTALRAGDSAGIQPRITSLNNDLNRITTTRAEVGTRAAGSTRPPRPPPTPSCKLKSSLSDVENADLPKVIVDLKLQEIAYQAALAATSRVMQPSLLDFLR